MTTVIDPEKWRIAELIITGYFPRLFAGINIDGINYQINHNNVENIYDIDLCIKKADKKIAGIDTEYKPGWLYGYYPYWSVAKYTLAYNKGNRHQPKETVKVKYMKQFPHQTFWMPIRSDYKEAGIISGYDVINSPLGYREKPSGLARDIRIYEFPKSALIFCEILDPNIEDFVIEYLSSKGIL